MKVCKTAQPEKSIMKPSVFCDITMMSLVVQDDI